MVEHKVKISAKKDAWENVPENLAGIQDGDVLVLSEIPEGNKCDKNAKFFKGVSIEANDMVKMCMKFKEPIVVGFEENFEKEFEGDKEVLERTENILRKNGYEGNLNTEFTANTFPEMYTFRDKKITTDADSKTFSNHSIVNKKIDKKIIEEMIEKIDKNRITKMYSVAMGHGRKPADGFVDKFIEQWAEAKYDFYIAFDRNLTISTPIVYNMDANEMMPLVYDMYTKFPKFAASLDKIVEESGIDPYINNKCAKSDFFSKYASDFYKPGMKLSKFFSQIFQDEKFDIEFSKVMQDREIRGNVVISIDPYDFFTAATNMHGWSSCVALFKDMAAGSITWCTDPNALIAFRDNGKVYHYDKIYARGVGGERVNFDFGKNSFDGNSKSWRQIINVDKDNCAFLFGREYPQNKDIDIVADKARELIESVIGKKIGISEWDNYGDLMNIHKEKYFGTHPVYRDVYLHHYSDIAEWSSLVSGRYPTIKKALIAPTGTDMSKVDITAGGKMFCPICGQEIPKNSSSVCCGND